MDNDLMARRLRPPSEPPRPSNGHSPNLPPPAPAPQALQPAYSDVRADVPWDRPADEEWPPVQQLEDDSHVWPPAPPAQPTNEPDYAQQPVEPADVAEPVAPTWPSQDMSAVGPPAEAASVQPAPAQPVAASSDDEWQAPADPWDAYDTSGWGEPGDWDLPPTADIPAPVVEQAAPPPVAEPVVVDEPSAIEMPSAFDAPSAADELQEQPTDMVAPGGPAWDRPDPADWDAFAVAELPFAPADAPQGAPVEAESVDPQSTDAPEQDPYDAFAPVLSDVDASPSPWWPAWGGSTETAGEEALVEPESVAEHVTPTPPADLFTEPELESEPEAVAEFEPEVEPAAEAEPEEAPAWQPEAYEPHVPAPQVLQTSVPIPQPSGEPLVLRLELEIVDNQVRVRNSEASIPPGPEADFTPRHPEFEPRSQTESAWLMPPAETQPQPPAAAEAADLPWALPRIETPATPRVEWPEQEPSVAPALPDLWAEPEPASAPQPPVAQPVTPAPARATAAAAATSARPDQADLWFLASEPEAYTADVPAEAANEPSSLMTMGLTVFMAIVVVGLVLAFLWLMTSLPILR